MNESFNNKTYWDYIADTHSNYKAKIVKFLGQYGAKEWNLLDIGCSDGGFSTQFFSEFNLYWLDIAENAIKNACAKWIDAIVLDLNNTPLPYKDNFFDIVIMSEVMEHLFDTDTIIDDIKSKIKPGGIFAITVPNIAKHINRIRLLFGVKMTDVDYCSGEWTAWHIRVYYTSLLKKQLELHGFEILKTSSSFTPHLFMNKWINTLGQYLWDIFPNLGDHAVIICKKI